MYHNMVEWPRMYNYTLTAEMLEIGRVYALRDGFAETVFDYTIAARAMGRRGEIDENSRNRTQGYFGP